MISPLLSPGHRLRAGLHGFRHSPSSAPEKRCAGAAPLICAELDEGITDRDTVTKELLQMCADEIEGRSQPAGVVFVDTIPLTGLMKNDYKLLEAQYEDYDYTAKQ